jgi:hypothetical protein
MDCGTCTTPATCGGGGTANTCGCGPLMASSEGPRSATVAANDASFGVTAWATPANARASDGAYATARVTRRDASQYLVLTGFGLTIPAGSTVLGIVVQVERSGALTTSVRDAHVRLVSGGVILPTDRARTTTDWPALIDGTATYGGAADLWGGVWTGADVGAADFGVAIAATSTSMPGETARIDHVQITVHYMPTCPVP